MTVNVQIYKGQKPTEEQRQEIREAAKRMVICDEEAPELSLEQMQRYGKAAIDKKTRQPLLWSFPMKIWTKHILSETSTGLC